MKARSIFIHWNNRLCGVRLTMHKFMRTHATRRLQRRSLRLPTRSIKSTQTGHLYTIRLRQGRIPGIFVCRSKFPSLKVGRGSWLANMALKSSTWSRKSFFSHRQYHGFSACVDAGYDIKSITDIQQTMQYTLYEYFYYKHDLLALRDCILLVYYYHKCQRRDDGIMI